MKNVAVILAEGFEELEVVSIVDILRRADINSVMIGLNSQKVRGAHRIIIETDSVFSDTDFSIFDMVVLPGGLPGAEHLANSKDVQSLLKNFKECNKKIAAICAAPMALATAGVLDGRYTCYPGFEHRVLKEGYDPNANVVMNENIITSKGPATAMEFSLELVKILNGNESYNNVKAGLLF